jgi:Nucleoside-diphosphate-sugar epimerases
LDLGRSVFISGGTGYLGRSLIPRLMERGHEVTALARPSSEHKAPPGCGIAVGNALDAVSFKDQVRGSDTFVHLTGVPHPAPWKGEQFRAIDGVSLRASLEAAGSAGIEHFVYVSVAQPAPVMRSYIEVRQECEAHIRKTGIPATVLRPWYVLGPGHRWPVVLRPLYRILESIPATESGARRLGLVTLADMVNALLWSIEHPPTESRIFEVPDIRLLGRT